MVWARLDDEILDNPKIARVGVLGFAIHVAAITWCNRNLTDGFIPRRRVACLLDLSALAGEYLEASGDHPRAVADKFLDGALDVGDPAAERIAARLVSAGLWLRDEEKDGYWLNDFLQYNPSREKVLADRKRGAERKKAERIADSAKTANDVHGGVHGGHAPDSVGNPDGPVPVPINSSSKNLSGGVSAPPNKPKRTRKVSELSDPPAATTTPEELSEWVSRWNIDIAHGEFRKFWDTHLAKGNRFKDWGAAWRTWLRRSEEFARREPKSGLRVVQSAENRAWDVPKEAM